MSTERHHLPSGLNTCGPPRQIVRAPRKQLILASMMTACMLSSGCLALSMQREIMEGWREPPEYIDEDETIGWSETFETGAELNSVVYENQTNVIIDETVSKLVISFTVRFPYSGTLEELIGNETNEVRFGEARLWEPGAKQSGGNPFWEIRATQDYSDRVEWNNLDFIDGTWSLEVEARGWGVTTPVEQLSFHDSFDLYTTITKPCVHFPETHEVKEDGNKECTFLSDLED